jgi:hypothetical protein
VRPSSGLAGPVFVAFPPSAVTPHRDRPGSSARNVWQGKIAGMKSHGDQIRVDLTGELLLTADLTTGRRRTRPRPRRHRLGHRQGHPADPRLPHLSQAVVN